MEYPDKRNLAERLYNANVLPDGNLQSVDLVNALSIRMEKDIEESNEKEEGDA